jgi:hypothetical protein
MVCKGVGCAFTVGIGFTITIAVLDVAELQPPELKEMTQ